jgi:hypothetical protein
MEMNLKDLQANAPVVLSILALLFTLLNFVYVYLKDKESKRRWDSTNLARLVIKNLRLQTWRVLTRADFGATNWGYDDAFAVIPVDDSGVMHADKMLAPASIIATRADSSVLDGTNAITVAELTDQIIARGLDPKDFKFQKLYRVAFELENSGATVASEIQIRLNSYDSTDTISNPSTSTPLVLQAGESTWTTINARMDLSERFSNEFRLGISISYIDTNKNEHEFTHSYIYNRSTGAFRRT